MTIPNILTLLRVLFTPLLVWLLLDHRFGTALVIFLLAGLTDGLDGFIARVFEQKSKLGAYLDPVADKLLLVSSFILLGLVGAVPAWLVVVTVSRDVIIVLGVATLAFHQVPVEIKPTVLSKINTLFQLITIFLMLVNLSVFYIPNWIAYTLFGTIGVLCFVTVFQYILQGIRIWEIHRTVGNNREAERE